jgi:hypothetical protein
MMFFCILAPYGLVGTKTQRNIFVLTAVKTSKPRFSPEDGDSMFHRNVAIYRLVYT